MLRSLLITVVIIRAIDTLKVFDIIFGTTGGGPALATEVVQTFVYRTAFSYQQFGKATAALPLLRRSTSPAIVNTLSTQAFFGVPQSAAYTTAKGGLMMLTRSMAVDFGSEGIHVNAVAPAFIDTRMALMEDGRHEHELEVFRAH